MDLINSHSLIRFLFQLFAKNNINLFNFEKLNKTFKYFPCACQLSLINSHYLIHFLFQLSSKYPLIDLYFGCYDVVGEEPAKKLSKSRKVIR